MNNNQPIYTIKIQAANPHEVYFNDLPIDKDFSNETSSMEIPINDFILKSGPQHLHLNLWPNSNKDIIDKIDFEYLNIQLLKYPNGMKSLNQGEYEIIQTFDKGDFEYSSKIEKHWTLNLDVNYESIGWSNSENLLEIDSNLLKEKVMNFYRKTAQIINNGDLYQFNELNKKRDYEVENSFYNDSDYIQQDVTFVKNRIFNSKNNTFFSENYIIKFYGNGKIVTLETTNGESPLYAEDNIQKYTYTLYLHIPKGSTELEIIR